MVGQGWYLEAMKIVLKAILIIILFKINLAELQNLSLTVVSKWTFILAITQKLQCSVSPRTWHYWGQKFVVLHSHSVSKSIVITLYFIIYKMSPTIRNAIIYLLLKKNMLPIKLLYAINFKMHLKFRLIKILKFMKNSKTKK